jgi:hypothetical protein
MKRLVADALHESMCLQEEVKSQSTSIPRPQQRTCIRLTFCGSPLSWCTPMSITITPYDKLLRRPPPPPSSMQFCAPLLKEIVAKILHIKTDQQTSRAAVITPQS